MNPQDEIDAMLKQAVYRSAVNPSAPPPTVKATFMERFGVPLLWLGAGIATGYIWASTKRQRIAA